MSKFHDSYIGIYRIITDIGCLYSISKRDTVPDKGRPRHPSTGTSVRRTGTADCDWLMAPHLEELRRVLLA